MGVAFVIPKPGKRPLESELIAFARDNLASFKVPQHVIFVESFPLTSGTDKIQKFKLRELASQTLGVALKHVPPFLLTGLGYPAAEVGVVNKVIGLWLTIVGALQAGSMMRAVTTLSLAGTMAVAFELIAPNGEVINIGRVDFDSEAPMQH